MLDTERFIEEIERRPAIYDVNSSEYNDRHAKMNAWNEVCQVMVPNWSRLTDEERNVEEKNLRGKWRNIRDYFMKELKLQKTQKSGSTGRKRKKYMYFDHLLFLMPTVENKQPRNGASMLLKHCKTEESDGEMDNPVIEEYDEPLGQTVVDNGGGVLPDYMQTNASHAVYARYPKQLCETTYAPYENELHDMLSSHSSQRANHDDEDYDKMFLLSLLPIVRQVPEEKKLDVRIQMQQVLALALRPPDK